MSWRPITEDDVLSALSEAEASSLRTKHIKPGQADPLMVIISQVTLEVREAIRSCNNNRLDTVQETLPQGAIHHAVAIIRHRLLTRFFTMEVSEARMSEYREALRYLEAVATCRRAVEKPDGNEAAPSPIAMPGINPSRQKRDWRNQDGI